MRLQAVLRSGVVAVAVIGAGAAFLILGIAGVAWRNQCAAEPGAGICFNEPEAALVQAVLPETPAAAPAVAVADAAPVADAASSPVPMSPREQQLAAAATMISSTFQQLSSLEAEINGPNASDNSLRMTASLQDAAEEAAVPAEPAAPAEVEVAAVADPEVAAPSPVVAKRSVTSVRVTPDGQPIWPPAAAAAIAAGQADEAVPAGVPQQVVASAQPTPQIEPLAFATPAAPVPQSRPAEGRAIKVGNSSVSVRSGPAVTEERLFVLAAGAEVEAMAVADTWVQIEDGRGRTGWAHTDYLEDADLAGLPAVDVPAAAPAVVEVAATTPAPVGVAAVEPEPKAKPAGDTRTVRGAGVNVRSGPGSSRGKLFALPGGEVVTVTDTERGWLKITDDRGRTGWVYKDYVTRG